jgi:hypothetical protein
MPAWCIGKEVAIRFLKPPLAEVVKLVWFALFYQDEGEPAAALAATDAGEV